MPSDLTARSPYAQRRRANLNARLWLPDPLPDPLPARRAAAPQLALAWVRPEPTPVDPEPTPVELTAPDAIAAWRRCRDSWAQWRRDCNGGAE